MVEPVALLALALDAAIGWPQAIYRRVGHPVGIFARAILWCELRWNLQSRTQISRRVSGVGTVLMLVALAGGVGAVLQYGCLSSPVPGPGYLSRCWRSEEHTSELQSLMRISYAVFCLKKKNTTLVFCAL